MDFSLASSYDPKFKPRGWYAGPGTFNALRCMRYDEQGHVSILSVLRRSVDHERRRSRGPPDRAARVVGSRPACEPRPADVHASAADARLRGPVRGRVLPARPRNRVVAQRPPAPGTPEVLGPG